MKSIIFVYFCPGSAFLLFSNVKEKGPTRIIFIYFLKSSGQSYKHFMSVNYDPIICAISSQHHSIVENDNR